MLDAYTDYLLATAKSATATGMSARFDGKISQDKVTHFLGSSYIDSTVVWQKAKPLVRRYQSLSDGVLIADDTVIEKAHTDENAMISWHWDHALGRTVKGVSLLSLLYNRGELSTPLNVHVIEKTEGYIDKKTGASTYKSLLTKNKITRQMIQTVVWQRVIWRYLLADSWLSSAETINFVSDLTVFRRTEAQCEFGRSVNPTVALVKQVFKQGRFRGHSLSAQQ